MMLLILFVCLVSHALAQMEIMGMCGSSSTAPEPTLTFTPWMAPQIGPTSTVYQAIMTTIFNVVDCRYCTVTNVQANPRASGPFTARTTAPVLIVSAVGCMPGPTAITRRDFRGFEDVPTTTLEHPTIPTKRAERRNTNVNLVSLFSGESDMNEILPVTGQAAVLLRELNTAWYSVLICNTPGLDLVSTCDQLREAAQIPDGAGLASINVDATQASDIVCFASVDGLDLNTTNTKILADIGAAIAGIELGGNYTGPANSSTDLCHSINYSIPYEYLGIDEPAVSSYVCSGTFPSSTTFSTLSSSAGTSTATVTALTITALTVTGPTVTGISGTVATGTGFSGTGAVGTGAGGAGTWTGPVPPFANSTTFLTGPETSAVATGATIISSEAGTGGSTITAPEVTGSGTVGSSGFGTGLGTGYGTGYGTRRGTSYGTAASGTGIGYGSYGNYTGYKPTVTGGDTYSFVLPTATYNFSRLPPSPPTKRFYPAFTTSTKVVELRGYR